MTKFKDPNARLDYPYDWADWLTEGDSVTAATWVVTGNDDALVVEAEGVGGTITTAWLVGGTLGELYKLTCHVTTANGREDDHSELFVIQDS